MFRNRNLAGVALALLLSAPGAMAYEYKGDGYTANVEGEIWFDGRVFFQDPQWNDQDGDYVQPSIAFTPNATVTFAGGQDVIRLQPFGRYDPIVEDRTHWDIREAYYQHKDDGWDVLVGATRVFWGVTESRHLVNIINQTDNLEDIDGEDYLGQPMVNVSLFGDWGTLDLYAMTGFRERQYPSQDGRYSLPISIDEDEARFDSEWEIWRPDFAARFRTTIDNWDFGISHFYGTSREPRFDVELEGAALLLPDFIQDQLKAFGVNSFSNLAQIDSISNLLGVSTPDLLNFADRYMTLVPIYDVINQSGLEVLGVFDDLLLKFEGATISGYGGDRIWAAVGGFEYTFTNVQETGIDVGVLGEFLYDSRDKDDGPYTVFDNDAFAGLRVSFNDLESTSLLVGTYVDVLLGSTIVSAELQTRIYDNVALSIEGRGYPYVSREDPLAVFENDSYVQVRFQLFF